MYDIGELIDHIRELESEKDIDCVYIAMVHGVNSCGDPFGWTAGVWTRPQDIPRVEDIMDMVAKTDYEQYQECGGDCCGYAVNCCGEMLTFKEFKDRFLAINTYSGSNPDRYQDLQDGKVPITFTIYTGYIQSDYDESTAEVVVSKVQVSR